MAGLGLVRIRLDVAYDGTGFKGWAVQPALRTVQGELQSALTTVLRLPEVGVVCAGRTDTGVHARGQVVHLDIPEEVSPVHDHRGEGIVTSLGRRLNGVLPADVRVLRVSEAPPGFDARFSAIWRRYVYRVADRPEIVDPLTRGHVLAWPRPLDVDAMNAAAEPLLGLQDFAAFCRRREDATTIRTLLTLSTARTPAGVVETTVAADAFCHHMVRSLMGCLVTVGEGRREPGWAREILTAAVRDPAVPVLPAHPLVLEEVGYPSDDELAAQGERARAKRTLR